MNLRQIDDFLERHSAGWNPFHGDFRISKGSFSKKNFGNALGFTPVTGFGALNSLVSGGGSGPLTGLTNEAAGLAGYKTPSVSAEEKEMRAAGDAAAAAAIKQAEFEASTKAGLERLALKRRKGFAASMIVDPGSALGSASTLGS